MLIYSVEPCQLQFCRELHSTHAGHINMQLKLGYSFPKKDDEDFNMISSTEFEVPAELEQSLLESELQNDIDHHNGDETIQSSPPASPSKASNSNAQSKKRKDRGKPMIDRTLLSPIQQLAQNLRELVKAGRATEESLRMKLDYVTYDVAFLFKLADILELDIAQVMSCRRPTRGQVTECIISQLLT
jgi:hypothetical protein